MATTVTLNAVTYSVPATGNDGWGLSLSNYLIALSTGVLSKAGGTFTLTADIDFGANFGAKFAYIKSRGTVSTAGVLRLANLEGVSWRNAANGANLPLSVSAADRLTFDTVVIPTISSTDTLTNKTMSGASNTFTNLPLTTGVTGVLPAANGGTGIANGSTLTYGDHDIVLDTVGFSSLTLPESGTLATQAGAETLSGKSMSGAFNTFTAIPLTSAVTGTLPVANGGTGVTSSTGSGANALATSPTLVTPILGTPQSGVMTNVTGLPLTTGVTGTLPIANGGTGQITAALAINALLPDQTSNSGKVLGTNGTVASWVSGLTTTLASTNIFVGNGSNIATAVPMSGVIAMNNAGLTSYTSAAFGALNLSTSGTAALGATTITGAASVSANLTVSGKIGVGVVPVMYLDVDRAGGGNYVAHFRNTTTATPYTVWVEEPASGAAGYPLLAVTGTAGTDDYLRVDCGGKVLLGPGARRADSQLTLNGGTNYCVSLTRTATVGTVTPVQFLDGANTVCGTISMDTSGNTVAYNTTSDVRLKTDIQNFAGMSLLSMIQAKEFERISNPGVREIGVIAQQVYEVFPQAVQPGGENPDQAPWQVDYSKFVGVLIKAVQELEARLAVLEAV